MEEEDVRGDRGLSVFRLRAVSRLTLVVRCTEIGYSVSTQVLGFRFGCGWCCVVGFLFGCCWFCVLLLCVSAWWNRGIADEVTMASYGRAVTGTAVMARSANEKKKKKLPSVYCGLFLGVVEVRTSTLTLDPTAEHVSTSAQGHNGSMFLRMLLRTLLLRQNTPCYPPLKPYKP